MKKLLPLLGLAAFAVLSMLTPSPAAAILDLPLGGTNGAPEIDPSAIGSAMALVMGGTALLADRFRR